ncbi:MAG: hypothetical protein MJ093_09435, partial [Saccharofermentans sp.]|nr:hypothetical protein [Saccharofermentans sp.]
VAQAQPAQPMVQGMVQGMGQAPQMPMDQIPMNQMPVQDPNMYGVDPMQQYQQQYMPQNDLYANVPNVDLDALLSEPVPGEDAYYGQYQADPYAQQGYAQPDPYAQQGYAQPDPYAQQGYAQPMPYPQDQYGYGYDPNNNPGGYQ